MRKMEKGAVIISGYLLKSPPESKLRNIRSWTRRYFVLNANKLLYYYKNEKEKKPIKDPIKLDNCKCVEANLNHERFKFVFSVVLPQRIYYLVAGTQLEMEDWVDKLIKVCGFKITDECHSQGENSIPKRDTAMPGAHTQPQGTVTVPKSLTLNPHGPASSSLASSRSSLTSPSGACPLSIPKHLVDEQNKSTSADDPSNPHALEARSEYHERIQWQSEQVGILTSSTNFQGTQNRANYDMVPSPRPLSSHSQQDNNYDDVPIPQPCEPALSRIPEGNSGNHFSAKDYKLSNQVSMPRPVSQASNTSSQDVYDLVPPPRPLSSSSQDGESLYDVPPKVFDQENYDIVPPVNRPVPMKTSNSLSTNYDTLPPRNSALNARESAYDVLPPGRAVQQESYDIDSPEHRCVSRFQPEAGNENYDILPKPHQTVPDKNYGKVPSARPNAPKPNHVQSRNKQELYDVLPRKDICDIAAWERDSAKEKYDIVPPVHRAAPSKANHTLASQECYDVVPCPRPSYDTYDIVPSSRASETYDVVPPPKATKAANCNGHDQHFSDIYDVPPNLQPIYVNDPVHFAAPARPAPYKRKNDPYDTLPTSNRPVSADSGLNASFSSINSLKSEGDDDQEDKYDSPLPPLPNTRDSGSLSNDSADDDADSKEIYDRPPSWGVDDSIYDVPPNKEGIYDQLPKHSYSDEVYDTPPGQSDDIYAVPPSSRNLGFGNERSACPVVDRSTKRPPRVNRATKPKTSTPQNHSYCNMAPPVDRSSKRKVFPKTEPSYVNLDGPRTRTQTLPLVKTLPGNSSGGGFFNPMKECPIDFEDELDYTLMKAPTRSEMTRCYSSCKENCRRASDNQECYEEMTVLPTTRQSGDRRSSSSSSSLADNEELYTPMNAMEQRHRRQLLYAEVEIVEGMQNVRIPASTQRKQENTNYTFINEESTRALLQTSHARQGLR